MLTVISPAKRLDWAARDVEMTTPDFMEDAVTLARAAKRLSQADLRKLMDISADLAKLNADRFKAFETDAIPGADFIDPAIVLTGGMAVISVEPVPDNSPLPFGIKPLVDSEIEDLGAGVPQELMSTPANAPTGSVGGSSAAGYPSEAPRPASRVTS